MNVERSGVHRREVVEFYVRYDCEKTGRPVPDLASWEWTSADALDAALTSACLKHGIVTGYLIWDFVALSLADLRSCAVESRIFPGASRVLGVAEQAHDLQRWKPDRGTAWLEAITGGQALERSAAMILRPAVRSEQPAAWYLEDGSGRATALLQHAARFTLGGPVACAYVGRVPDRGSTFMRTRFGELLGGGAA